MMFANGLMHVTAAVIEGRYVPGLVTAAVLYLPYYPVLIVKLIREKLLRATTAIVLAVAGAIPMFVQGYRVMFLGSRLW